MGGTKNPEFFFSPKSIAVVGASDVRGKLSAFILEGLKRTGFPGAIYPVNPKYKTVGGMPCFPTIADIGEEIDIAVFAVPAELTPGIIRGALGRLKGAIIVSGGFAEIGEIGRIIEKELKEIVRHEGIRIIGPNCMGIYDTSSRLDTFFIPDERMKRPGPGGLSMVSQSGSFAITAMDQLAAEGIGVARIISYGNKADINEADCLELLADDDYTHSVAVYIESVEEGRRFVEAASRCSSKKPVMVVKVGRSEAAASAARSHTGAIAGRYEIYRAAFRKAGLIELYGYEEFISGCKAFGLSKPALGKRVMIITDGGGIGVGIADACSAAGLDLPPLNEDIKEEAKAALPPYCAIGNPLDLTGSATDELFADSIAKTMTGDYYDMAIVAPMWGPPALTDGIAGLIADKASVTGKPVIICTPGGELTRKKMQLFRNAGLPVFPSPESAARAAAVLCATKKKTA